MFIVKVVQYAAQRYNTGYRLCTPLFYKLKRNIMGPKNTKMHLFSLFYATMHHAPILPIQLKMYKSLYNT